MYKLGLYKDKSKVGKAMPDLQVEGENINSLIAEAIDNMCNNGVKIGFVLDEKGRLVERINEELTETFYFVEDGDIFQFSGELFQICNRMKLRSNRWYMIDNTRYGEYTIAENKRNEGIKRYNVYSTDCIAMITNLVDELSERIGGRVNQLVFNGSDIIACVKPMVGYTIDADGNVRVEFHRR